MRSAADTSFHVPGHIHDMPLESGEYEVTARLTTSVHEIDSAPMRSAAH
jgi:hypothetical protein